MPTRTFLNLPKDKRIRILKAAKKEFSRVPMEKAVIANIVKDAEIPRGSFYQYFENIEDVFTYLLKYLYGVNQKKFLKRLEEADNDYFEALKLSFSDQIDKLTKNDNRQFRINVSKALLGEGAESVLAKIDGFDELEYDLMEVYPEDVRKTDKFNRMLKLIGIVAKNCIEKYLLRNSSIEEVKTDYNQYIDFLKLGFTKG